MCSKTFWVNFWLDGNADQRDSVLGTSFSALETTTRDDKSYLGEKVYWEERVRRTATCIHRNYFGQS
jgi:hypothetical protein